jgi:sigma-B regulation protein RsbU (phosphoserine phosphatase)
MRKKMTDHTNAREDLISQVPLFSTLTRAEIHHLAQTMRPCELAAGKLLFEEGEKGERFYILIDGEVEIIKALGTPEERLLTVRGAGTFIGEMSLILRDGLRTASVRALTPARLLEMTRAEFDDLIQRQPVLAYEMVRVLSERLDESQNATIDDLRKKNIQLTQAYLELEAAQSQIIEKEKLERELEVAREIQLGILPRSLPQYPGIVFDARITPTRAVGGDFYDFIPLGNKRIGIAVGDVSDHGVASALFMALTVTLLRAEARRPEPLPQVLQNVNRQLLGMNEADMFVTILYGELDYSTRQFNYVRAGHELPLVLDGRGEFLPQNQGRGMPLGLFENPDLDQQTLVLGANDTLLLYTDGATDAFDPHGERFGQERLRSALRDARQSSVEDICQRLLSRIESHSADAPQYDDITLLSLHIAS